MHFFVFSYTGFYFETDSSISNEIYNDVDDENILHYGECISVIKAKKQYKKDLPKELSRIADEKLRKKIAGIVYSSEYGIYDNYSYNQAVYYQGAVNEDGNEVIIDFKNERDGNVKEDKGLIVDILNLLLSHLSELERKIIWLYDADFECIDIGGKIVHRQRTFKELEQILNIPDSTLWNMYDRAMGKLKELKNKILDKQTIENIKEVFKDADNNIYYIPSCGKTDIAETVSNECPCRMMEYLKGSFKDDKTVCPGVYTTDGKYLLCAKKITYKIKSKIPAKILTIKEAMVALDLSQNKVVQYRDTYRLPATIEKRKKIIGSLISDCGQEVYHKENPMDVKYALKPKRHKYNFAHHSLAV